MSEQEERSRPVLSPEYLADPLEAAARLEALIRNFNKGDLNSEQQDVLTVCVAVRRAVEQGSIHAHHGGTWELLDGVCQCECPRCWNRDLDGGTCLCSECSETAHVHPSPAVAGEERG